MNVFNQYRITEGLILITLGFLLLAKNFGYLEDIEIWKFWPLILVAFGIRQILKRKDD